MTERGWVSIENAFEIPRPPENVLDYLTDVNKEVEWNPRTRRVEKLISGPIGLGTWFGAEWIKGNPTIIEYVTFERPTAWASVARSRRLDAKGEGRILPTERGSRVVVRTELRPKGLIALLFPVLRRTMRTREDQNLKRVKAILEGKASCSPGHQDPTPLSRANSPEGENDLRKRQKDHPAEGGQADNRPDAPACPGPGPQFGCEAPI